MASDRKKIRMDNDDIMISQKEQRFVPDRISGDMPFDQYRSLFLEPTKYLEFLKMLEQSKSRHDFLFWLFDVVTVEKPFSIEANELDKEMKKFSPYVSRILQLTTNHSTLSKYLMYEYPMIFHIYYEDIYRNPNLVTVSNNDALFEYRTNAYSKITHKKFMEYCTDEGYEIDLMRGLTMDDFPKGPKETSYEDRTKVPTHSYFDAHNHFMGLLTFTTKLPDSNDCVLVYTSPYKILQVETYMKNIDINEFDKIDVTKMNELFKKNSVVVVAVDLVGKDSTNQESVNEEADLQSASILSNHVYKRAKLLCNISSEISKKVWVHFVDYGEIATVSIRNIYIYKFNKDAPEFLTVVVPGDKLPKVPEKNDFFVFDLNKMKYYCVGRPTENFNPASNPLDELDTDTESVYFGPGAVIDWGDEEEDSGDDDDKRFEYNDDKIIVVKNKVIPPGNAAANIEFNESDDADDERSESSSCSSEDEDDSDDDSSDTE